MIGWTVFFLILILSTAFMIYVAKDQVAASFLKGITVLYVVGSFALYLIEEFVK